MSRCGSGGCISKCPTRFSIMPPLVASSHVTPGAAMSSRDRSSSLSVGFLSCNRETAVLVRRAGTTPAQPPGTAGGPANQPCSASSRLRTVVGFQQVLVLGGRDPLPQPGEGRDPEVVGDEAGHDTAPSPVLGRSAAPSPPRL